MSSTTTMHITLPEDLLEYIQSKIDSGTYENESEVICDGLRELKLKDWQIAQVEESIAQADAGKFATDEEVKAVFAKFGVDTDEESLNEDKS